VRLGWVLFVVLVAWALLIGGGWAGIYLVTLRALSLAFVAVALAAWLVLSLLVPSWRPSTAVWPTLVVPVVTLAILMAISTLPRLGLEYVAWSVLLVALYLLLVRVLATDTARARIGALAAMLALVIGVLYLAQVMMHWLEWWGLVGRLTTPPLRPLYASLSLGGPGAVFAVQVLLTTAAIAALGVRGRRRAALAAILVATTAAVAVASASRSGWVAIAGATAVTAGLWTILAVREGSLRQRAAEWWARRSVRLALAASVVGVLAGLAVVGPLIVRRMLESGTGGREQYYTTSLRMFADSPLVGHGPGTWPVLRLSYTEAGELDWYIPHAHNLYLHTLAELGLVGLLAGGAALLPVAWLLWRALRGPRADSRRWAWGGIFGLAFIGFFSLFDFLMNVPAVILAAALPIAWLDASERQGVGIGNVPEAVRRWVGRLAQAALWSACLLAVVVIGRAELVALDHQAAERSAWTGEWDAAGALAADVVAADPDFIPYRTTRGLVASGAGSWTIAAGDFARTAGTDDLPTSWLGLAQARLELGAEEVSVLESLERALRVGREQPSIAFAAATLYERLGRMEEADALYAAVIADYPSLAADRSWWEQDPSRSARFPGLLEAAKSMAPARAWEFALMAGELDEARALAGEGESRIPGVVVEAWAGDPASLAAVYEAIDAAPTDAGLLSWGARLAARSGELDRVARYQRLAVYEVTEGGELPGTEIRVARDGWMEYVPAGSLTGYAGHYLYRRPLARDLLPPGLPRIVHAPAAGWDGD